MSRIVAACLLLAMAPLSPSLQASGSYIGGPPRAPVRTDSVRYELGKAVFGGKVRLPSTPVVPAPSQIGCLTEWQSRIPRSAQRSVDLPALAGRLSKDRFEALAYFIQVRYNVKCESAPRP